MRIKIFEKLENIYTDQVIKDSYLLLWNKSKFYFRFKFYRFTGGYICYHQNSKKILKNKYIVKLTFIMQNKNIIHNFKFCEVPIVYKKSLSKIKYSTILLAILNLLKLSKNKKI